MRPEYSEAVDAVRWGWSLWLAFLLPAIVIWTSVLARPLPSIKSRAAIACGAFALACFLFWILTIVHGNRIQGTKERHMQTDAEMEDWSSDTWHAFAPFTAMPVALVYCALNLLGAGVVRGAIALVTHWATSRTHRKTTSPSPDTAIVDKNPYHPPRRG